MIHRRIVCLWPAIAIFMAWVVPIVLADECPERIDEAQALIREAEQALATAQVGVDRTALQEQLQAARASVAEAQALHNANQHDASVEKAYAALAAVKEVLNTLKP
jgi:predicted DNA-binding protein (UPF0251 family)